MKKVKYFLFSLMCLFCCNIVFAENEVVVKSTTPVYDENNGVVVTEENGEYSVVFNDKDQSVQFDVVLKNNTTTDIPIDNISIPTPTEDFLKYELTGINEGDVLKANSTKEVTISLETIQTEGWGRNFNIDLTANVNIDSSVLNPNTSDFIAIIIILALVIAVSLFILKNKKIARYGVLVISLCSIIPTINAKSNIVLPIKINVSFESQNVMKTNTCRWVGGMIQIMYCEDNDDFWGVAQNIKNIYIQNEMNELTDYEYKFDVSENKNGKVLAYLVRNSTNESYFDLYLQANGIIYANSNASRYFYCMNSLEKIEGLVSGFDTSGVTNMSEMFYRVNIEKLDLSGFNTSNVASMNYMFSEATIGNIDLSGFNTSNVASMNSMFSGATIGNIDLSEYDTSSVTDIAYMFSGSNITSTITIKNSNINSYKLAFNSSGTITLNYTKDTEAFVDAVINDYQNVVKGVLVE